MREGRFSRDQGNFVFESTAEEHLSFVDLLHDLGAFSSLKLSLAAFLALEFSFKSAVMGISNCFAKSGLKFQVQ